MKIEFGNNTFILHPSGALFWPEQSQLIISDLHLEKGSHYARQGYFLPPYDSHETLSRLHKVIKEFLPKKILLLGDCFHDKDGYERLQPADRDLFNNIISYDPLWIIGNHDGDFVPEGFKSHQNYILNGITFRHQAEAAGRFEISGHFHPKAEIMHKGTMITNRCFIEDGTRMILPAFGAYTGGLSVKHPSIANLMQRDARLYILGQNKIYAFDQS